MRQIDAIDQLNRSLTGIRVLKGIEVDILDDGNLDLPDTVLTKLDLVVAAIHSKFNLSRAQQTQRVLRAFDNPHVTLLAHPSGRLIGEREPYDVDMLQIIRKAKAKQIYLEVNAHPERLDLIDTHCRMAKDEGVLIAINSDAHSTQEFADLRLWRRPGAPGMGYPQRCAQHTVVARPDASFATAASREAIRWQNRAAI